MSGEDLVAAEIVYQLILERAAEGPDFPGDWAQALEYVREKGKVSEKELENVRIGVAKKIHLHYKTVFDQKNDSRVAPTQANAVLTPAPSGADSDTGFRARGLASGDPMSATESTSQMSLDVNETREVTIHFTLPNRDRNLGDNHGDALFGTGPECLVDQFAPDIRGSLGDQIEILWRIDPDAAYTTTEFTISRDLPHNFIIGRNAHSTAQKRKHEADHDDGEWNYPARSLSIPTPQPVPGTGLKRGQDLSEPDTIDS